MFRLAAPLALSCLALAPALRAADDAKPAGDLPLKKVVMFSSGVGFYEHRGDVNGDAQVNMRFNVKDVNDLLKSMVLQDLGGGRISTVTYGSKDPITKTLQTFAIDLTKNPTLGDILNQIRGEAVEVDAPNPVKGAIVGVEKRKKEIGREGQTVEVEMLNLLTAEGLRGVPLENVGKIKIADEKLDGELRQALKTLAMGHSTDKKTVTLNFLGAGARPVRVGYIQESPIWKTSYRLVLAEDKHPFLQGWAIVENTTEEDWNNVSLTLVSGRPISFIMDLYQSLYVSRPVVEPELFASLRPQMYGQDLARANKEFEKLSGKAALAAPAGPDGERRAMMKLRSGANAGAGFGINGAVPEAAAEALEVAKDAAFEADRGAQAMAQAGNVGELFQYVIDTPVTLPRQQSAMLPIVNDSVKGDKVSIYNQAVQVKHPLNGLRLTNSTDLHLMQGPITVFDGGAYAGDAKIEDLQPDTERLISYALDLDVEVAPVDKPHPEQLLSVKLIKGVMYTDHKYVRTKEYTIKNSAKKAKKVLVEQPFEAEWTLVTPKEASEKTRNLYRFAVQADPGKPAALTVEEHRAISQQVAITNLDYNAINFYINAKVVSDKVKAALQEIVKRKRALEALAVQRQQLDEQIKTIDQEQNRIRQNMAQLDHTTDLYKRYVKKFGEQEDSVEKIRGQVRSLQTDEAKQRQELDVFLLSLDLS